MPEEAIQADGTVAPALTLTPSQRGAIYNGLRHERVHTADVVTASVGAPAVPSPALRDVPGMLAAPAAAEGDGDYLKYATVEGDVVIVDPIHMRVVEVIHSGTAHKTAD